MQNKFVLFRWSVPPTQRIIRCKFFYAWAISYYTVAFCFAMPLLHCTTLFLSDHVYFVHPSTDISVNIAAECLPMYQSTYRPSVDRYVGRHISQVSVDISTGVLVDMSTDTRPICWSICRPRVVVRLSADMSIDRLPTFRRYFTATCPGCVTWNKVIHIASCHYLRTFWERCLLQNDVLKVFYYFSFMYFLQNSILRNMDRMLKTVDRYTTDSQPILRWQSMVDVSAECRPLYRLRYLPIVGRYVSRYLGWYIGRYVDRHLGRDIGRVSTDVGRHIGQHSADMLTDISVEGCTKYTWSQKSCDKFALLAHLGTRQTRLQVHLPNLDPHPPYNVENYYLQLLMIFNIVMVGGEKRVFKRKASLLSNLSSKTQIIR